MLLATKEPKATEPAMKKSRLFDDVDRVLAIGNPFTTAVPTAVAAGVSEVDSVPSSESSDSESDSEYSLEPISSD